MKLHLLGGPSLYRRVSHIAAALAKSKGKKVSPLSAESIADVPLIRIGPPPNPFLKSNAPTPVAAAAPVQSTRPHPAGPSHVATPELPPSAPATRHRALLIVAVVFFLLLAGAAAWVLFQPDTTFAPVAPPPARPIPADSPAALAKKGPSPALAAKVRELAITAAAGGGSQRLSVGGKVFEPGETVVEGLILQSIENEEIVFRDALGHLYTRRL